MTRKEQIEQASVEYQMSTRPMALGGDAFADMIYKANINPSFISGAEWADEHPKEGLVDINKAIEYLANYLLCTGYNLQTKAQFIHNFRIAMEK